MNKELSLIDFKKFFDKKEIISLVLIAALIFMLAFILHYYGLYIIGAVFWGRAGERWIISRKLNKVVIPEPNPLTL